MPTRKVEYSNNNSGGYWWLTDADWEALEKAGWIVEWFTEGEGIFKNTKGEDGRYRYLGAAARSAYREGLSLEDAIAEFERVTGQCAEDEGCSCCGQPHNFYEYDEEGKKIW